LVQNGIGLSAGVGNGSGRSDLLVYIPTYNRPNSLRRQLAALAEQRSDWPGTVRILISDNASSASSDDELQSLALEYSVEVRRNAGNIGGNANIALGFVFTRVDEYLWILSDNDTIGPSALRYIAEHGLSGGADAIVFSTKLEQPSEFIHTWDKAWEGVGENGLISNVIYRSSVFLPHASEAFFYHNTSFPHVCVQLATLRERNTLRYRALPRSSVFAPGLPHGEHPGDYRLSFTGMPQLLPLLPQRQAQMFARTWLRDQGREFFRQRDSFPGVHLSSTASIRRYGGFRARAIMRILAIRHALVGRFDAAAAALVRRLVPERIKRSIRSHRS